MFDKVICRLILKSVNDKTFFYTKVENKQYKAETTSFTLIIHLWSETNSSQII